MIPNITQIDTDQVSTGLKLVGNNVVTTTNDAGCALPPRDAEVSRPADLLRPELRKLADASWEQHEEAYRYLGR